MCVHLNVVLLMHGSSQYYELHKQNLKIFSLVLITPFENCIN